MLWQGYKILLYVLPACELVEVIARVHAGVHLLQEVSRGEDAALREADLGSRTGFSIVVVFTRKDIL